MNQNNPYSIVYCSSEEPNHRFDNLFRFDSPQGWVSTQNPIYPIEIIIDLKSSIIVTGIEIVSHQFMIANKVVLYGTQSEKLNSLTDWDIIGFFTFNTNQRSQWVARELKHINIDKKQLRYLRLIIEGVHDCPPNRTLQCSFVSFNILSRKTKKNRMNTLSDLVEDITQSKLDAVAEENYAAAAEFKDQLDNIAEHRPELEIIFKKKIEALSNEDYLAVDEMMNSIKSIIDIDRENLPKPEIIKQPEPVIVTNIQNDEFTIDEPEQSPEPSDGFFLTGFGQNTVIAIAEEPPKEEPKPEPVKVVDEYPPPEPQPEKKIKKERAPKFNPPPPDKPPQKQDTAEELSEDFRSEAEVLISFFGEAAVAQAYSSSWALRSQGFEKICILIKGLKNPDDKIKAINGMTPLMRRRLSDGLKAVYCPAVEQIIDLCTSVSLQGSHLSTLIHQLFPIVITKLGDSNQRINDVSNHFVFWCAEKDKTAMNELIQYSVKPPTSPNQYHILLAKMSALTYLIDKIGIGEKGKMRLGDVMGLIVPCLDSRKEEVRKNSFKVMYSCMKLCGSSCDKYLKNVPRIIRDQLAAAKEEPTP